MVELLVGMIASGKSTYAKNRANAGAIIINDDAIVTALHGGDYNKYSKSLKPLYKAVENQILQTAVTMGLDVVVDRPNYSRAMRRRYISIAKSIDAKVSLVVFNKCEPEEHAMRRFASDSRGRPYEEWLEAAMHHDALYEEPSLDEGVDEIICLK